MEAKGWTFICMCIYWVSSRRDLHGQFRELSAKDMQKKMEVAYNKTYFKQEFNQPHQFPYLSFFHTFHRQRP